MESKDDLTGPCLRPVMDHRTRPVMILEVLDLSGIDQTLGGSVRSLPLEHPVNRIRARSNLFFVSFLVTSGPPYKPIIVTVLNLIRPHHPQPPTSPPPVPVRRLPCPRRRSSCTPALMPYSASAPAPARAHAAACSRAASASPCRACPSATSFLCATEPPC